VEVAWEGAEADEVGRVAKVVPGRGDTLIGKVIVRIDRRYLRPAEVDTLLGDATQARTKLGWEPEIRFPELVAEMVREDLRAAELDALVERHGHTVHKRNDGYRKRLNASRRSTRS